MMGVWALCYLIRIFTCCLKLIECYPQDLPAKDMYDIHLMEMRCHFVLSASLVSEARTEDRVEEQLQRYVEARQHIASFDGILQGVLEKDPEPLKHQVVDLMVSKSARLFVFDFEAATCLRSWDDFGQIVRKAKRCRDEVMYKAMGDCLLRSQAPGKGK